LTLGKDKRIDIRYEGVHATADGGELTSWDEVKGMTFNNSSFGNTLIITHFDKGLIGARTSKIKLKGLGKQEAHFKAVLGSYWQRHQIMRAQQQQQQRERPVEQAAEPEQVAPH
jgi:hypothetical protein